MSYRTARGGFGRPVLASLCAGPVFWTSVTLSLVDEPNVRLTSLLGLMIVLPLTSAFGFVLAIMPNLIGTAMLRGLGARNDGVRLPAFWALIGGLVAGAVAAACGADEATTAAFAITGAASALICRAGTVWP